MLGYFKSSRIIFISIIILFFVANFAVGIIVYGDFNIINSIISYIPLALIIGVPINMLINFIDKIRFSNLFVYWNNCEIEKFTKELEKILRYYHPKSRKKYLELLLAQCYNETNKLEQTKNLIIHEGYLNTTDTNKVSILLIVCDYYTRINDYKEAMNTLSQIYYIYCKGNISEQYWHKYFNYQYYRFYFMINCHDSKKKKLLNEAEKFFINGMDTNNTMLGKVLHADQLVTIYEKLGNNEKAEEYAKFVIENHKDYYVDPKRIEKYSKKTKSKKVKKEVQS